MPSFRLDVTSGAVDGDTHPVSQARRCVAAAAASPSIGLAAGLLPSVVAGPEQ